MFTCKPCHVTAFGSDDCFGLRSRGPCESCHENAITTDCHCAKQGRPYSSAPTVRNRFFTQKEPLMTDASSMITPVQNVQSLVTDLRTAEAEVKRIKGLIAAVKVALHSALHGGKKTPPAEKAKRSAAAKKGAKTRSQRRGLPVKPGPAEDPKTGE